MKIESVEVYGFRRALFGMRNPMNSWDKADTDFLAMDGWSFNKKAIIAMERPVIGPNDMKLAKKLIKAGTDHRKFLRQIMIWMDITIPIYVWSEFDTYKVATVRNSCSTMHKLGSRDLTQEDFQLPISEVRLSDLNEMGRELKQHLVAKDTAKANEVRRGYKNDLPSGYLQKATYTMSYETARSMYFARRNHRLPEWNERTPDGICACLMSLPYMKEFADIAERK